jgi:hypothetical protein
MDVSALIITLLSLWGYLGIAVAIAFLVIGIDRIDPNARGAYAFRPLLVPGIIVLWPLVVWRWVQLERGIDPWEARYRAPVRAHGVVAVVLAILLPAIFVGSLALRQTWLSDVEPTLIQPSSGNAASSGEEG